MKRLLGITTFILVIIFGILVFPKLGRELVNRLSSATTACNSPIPYSIGSFDIRFGISQAEFATALGEAEVIWEKATNKDLFAYKTDANLKVNLIFDSRQEATNRLKKLGYAIDSSRTNYDKLKSLYTQIDSEYESKLLIYNSHVKNLEAKKTNYEEQVSYWNQQGGAPKEEYEKLQRTQEVLNDEINELNAEQDEVNKLAADLNATASQLNHIASALNLDVTEYNTVGSTQGEEFQEGIFKSDETGTSIEIYQFDTRAQLVRVLAHELGHALGLDHVEDKNAIMYRLNQSKNSIPTEDDITELTKVCTTNKATNFLDSLTQKK